MEYKKSIYTRTLKIDDDTWLVHNLASGSECILDKAERLILDSCKISKDTGEFLKQLYEMGIIVNSKVDEKACLELERKISMYSFSTEEVGYVIAPTMDCNAHCFYCYENETRKSCYMDSKTEEALIKYIKEMALGKKKLFVSWFGGEPLLCKDLLLRVSKSLTDFSVNNNIEYYSEMTTNGYYLNEIVDEIHSLELSDIQVSIDGFKDDYEKRKEYINKNSWEKVVDNIYKISNLGIHITLRFNFDKRNIASIKKAVSFFIKNEKWNDNISIYFYPLEPNGKSCQFLYKESEYEEIMADLYTHLYAEGYYKNKSYALDFHKLSLPCYGATLGTVAIDYKGLIYQCQHLLCREEFAIGNVFDGIVITESISNWYDGTVKDECQKCDVLPLCQGGCVTKPKLGQENYVCHMMKYRLQIQEKLKVQNYIDNQ